MDRFAAEVTPKPPLPPSSKEEDLASGRRLGGEVLITARRLAVMDSGRFALAELSFELREREVAALIGPGAGRLARVLLGQTKPVVGALEGPAWNGSVHPAPAAFLPRSKASVAENLALVHRAAGHENPAEAAEESARLFGLESLAQAQAQDLGPEDLKLLVLAASLARDSGVAVLRSPTIDLDQERRAVAEAGIAELAAQAGRAFFLLPSGPEEIEAIATSIMRVDRGVTDHLSIEDYIRNHGPRPILTLSVRSAEAAGRLAQIMAHLDLDQDEVENTGRTFTCAAPGGADDLVRICDMAKVAGVDFATLSFVGPTLVDALAQGQPGR